MILSNTNHQLEQNSRFIEEKRSAVEFSPKDDAQVVSSPFLFPHPFHPTHLSISHQRLFLTTIDPNASPLHKHNTARQALKEKEIARLHAEAAAANRRSEDEDSDDEPRRKRGKKGADEEDGESDGEDEVVDEDGDVVRRFRMSDDEEEEDEDEPVSYTHL